MDSGSENQGLDLEKELTCSVSLLLLLEIKGCTPQIVIGLGLNLQPHLGVRGLSLMLTGYRFAQKFYTNR